MDMSLYLSALINVFNVVPAFLLPIFSNGVQFFFQVLDSDAIVRFEEADLSQFTPKNIYQILDRHLYKPNSPAVYGIDLPGGRYTYGGSEKIADVYFSNLPDFAEYPDFVQSMSDFLMEVGIDKDYHTSHRVPAVLADVCPMHLKSTPMHLGRKKPSDLYQISPETFQSIAAAPLRLVETIPCIIGDGTTKTAAECYHILSATQQSILNDSDSVYRVFFQTSESVQADIVENAACAICKPNQAFSRTHNIFDFRSHIKDSHARYIVQYDKRASETPVELQIKLLDILFQYTPESYPPLFRRSLWSRYLLWNDQMVSKAYSSICTHSGYMLTKLSRPNLVKWGLHIEPPAPRQRESGDELDSADNCLIELLPSIEETANMEDAHLFWFEIKTLSHGVYAMLARNYKTGRNHFQLKEDSISSEDLINFIVALNHDVLGEKVMLIRLRSEKFFHLFDDRLGGWLSENEDKCTIHDVYHDIRGYYE